MKKTLFTIVLTLIFIFQITTANTAAADWTFEAFLGSAYSLPATIEINQEGKDTIKLENTDFATKPLEESPYYSWRVGKWTGDRAWEFELIHHKLYLEDTPPDVERFDITHGYNLLTFNRAWKKDNIIYRLGAGAVIGHPEFEIRGTKYSEHEGILGLGFYLGGPALQASAARTFDITDNIYAVFEGKFSAAHASLHVDDAGEPSVSAVVPNTALHGLIGMGYRF